MRTGAALLLVVAFATPIRSDDAKELDAFQGLWRVESVTIGDASAEVDILLIVRGDKVAAIVGEEKRKPAVRFELDARGIPKTIDFFEIEENGKSSEKMLEGVYEFDGDKLRICIAPVTAAPWNRPISMLPRDEDNFVTFRRVLMGNPTHRRAVPAHPSCRVSDRETWCISWPGCDRRIQQNRRFAGLRILRQNSRFGTLFTLLRFRIPWFLCSRGGRIRTDVVRLMRPGWNRSSPLRKTQYSRQDSNLRMSPRQGGAVAAGPRECVTRTPDP